MPVVGHDWKYASEAVVPFDKPLERPAPVSVQNILNVQGTDASNAEAVEAVEQFGALVSVLIAATYQTWFDSAWASGAGPSEPLVLQQPNLFSLAAEEALQVYKLVR